MSPTSSLSLKLRNAVTHLSTQKGNGEDIQMDESEDDLLNDDFDI
jgi:hypothetical protein